MSQLGGVFDAIKAQLASVAPRRVVTRNYKDFTARHNQDLIAGVFTVISRGESGYRNYPGRTAELGIQGVFIVGQIMVAGKDVLGSQVEEAEFLMVEDLQALCRSDLPAPIDNLLMTGFDQSGQRSLPYGWITAELTNQ